MRVLLAVNSDIGRSNTIGFRFQQIAAELHRQNIPFDLFVRKNVLRDAPYEQHIASLPYGRLLAGIVKLLQYHAPKQLAPIKRWCTWVEKQLFDICLRRFIRKKSYSYTVAHIGAKVSRRSIEALHKSDTNVCVDVYVGHRKYKQYLIDKYEVSFGKQIDIAGFDDSHMHMADTLIVPSEFVADTIEYAKIDTPMVTIPFGASRVVEESLPSTDGHVLQSNRCTFLYAGMINHRKGITYLLDAWHAAKLPHAELLLCGTVDSRMRPFLQRLRDEGKIDDSVKLLGFVDMKEYYPNADVFVFPTLFEGSAKVVYEAMSYQLPVITTPNAGSIIEHDKTGIIIPIADTKELETQMVRLYTDSSIRKKLGKAGAYAVQSYTWEIYAARVVSTYKKIVG